MCQLKESYLSDISCSLKRSLLIAVLDWVKYSFDLSPNLSPKRREALNFSPFPRREGG
ncbi:hypothetical protein [Nostoc sp.]|uniref:hypothetical protein n=1 Tax=Nostoc sp. TaxID=1180 RepID=UPI003005AE3D